VTQFRRSEPQIFLKKVGIGILDTAPTPALRQKGSGHEISYMAATYYVLPEGFICPLPFRVMMLI
jgi:hypothetical protein